MGSVGCLHKARAEVGKSSQELTLIGVRDIVAWIGGCGEHFGFVLSGRADGLNLKYQKKTEVKDEATDFGLSNQKDETLTASI